MDAEALLRRYLEQRRELGESELVLDQLSVEEVMRIIGAKRGAEADVPVQSVAPARDSLEPRAPRAESEPSAPLDWREALRAAGAAAPPDEPEKPATPDATPDATPVPAPVAPTGLVVGSGDAQLFAGPIGEAGSLEAIAEMVRSCTRCPLYKTATNGVPGEGSPTARLMCVGEAPGASEDETGRPFVGQAGQLLTKILEAIKLRRDEVFIANVLKHRPPGNRNPAPDEVTACRPYLVRQIELVRPKVIIAFGTFAAQSLLETKLTIGKLRGAVHRYHGISVIVTYHPAALLRNPAWKRPTWEDVQLARRILDSAPA